MNKVKKNKKNIFYSTVLKVFLILLIIAVVYSLLLRSWNDIMGDSTYFQQNFHARKHFFTPNTAKNEEYDESQNKASNVMPDLDTETSEEGHFASIDKKIVSNPLSREDLVSRLPVLEDITLANLEEIYLDWSRDYSLFSLINYRALESILAIYPRSKIRILLVAPQTADYYQWGNRISKTYFQKYQKRGYDVKVEVMYKEPDNDIPGLSYWQREFDSCCTIQSATQIRTAKDVPFHLVFYARLRKLVDEEGNLMFSDFSWYHTSSLPIDIRNGILLFSHCASQSLSNQPTAKAIKSHRAKQPSPKPAKPSSTRCDASSLMVFQERSNSWDWNVNMALLREQVRNVLFTSLKAIGGSLPSGTSSNSSATPRTARQTKVKNSKKAVLYCLLYAYEGFGTSDVTQEEDCEKKKDGSESQKNCQTETEVNQSSPIMKCINDRRDKKPQNDDSYNVEDSVQCLNLFITHCFDILGVKNDLEYLQQAQYITPIEPISLVGTEEVMRFNARLDELEIARGKVYNSSLSRDKDPVKHAVKWLGHAAYLGDWSLTVPAAMVKPLVRDDVAAFVESQQLEGVSCGLAACHPYHSDLSTDEVTTPSSDSGSKAILSNISCAPAFAIAGFMKTGTTYLFLTLSKHPQILQNLRGVTFKETGCYMKEGSRPRPGESHFSRELCFPFVERGEGWFFGDGTVYNAVRINPPLLMKSDNPNMKVIFVVRDPVSRIESHHRFSYEEMKRKGLQNLNIFATLINRPEGRLAAFRKLAVQILNSSDVEEKAKLMKTLLQAFHSGVLEARPVPGHRTSPLDQLEVKAISLVIHSLYFPAVAHWTEVFGLDKIHIVTSESLKVPKIRNKKKRQQSVEAYNARMAEIFDFLGVCPIKSIHRGEIHQTKEDSIPDEYKMNITTKALLDIYFRPFNTLLERHTGGSFGYPLVAPIAKYIT